jgi:hypothetical protein
VRGSRTGIALLLAAGIAGCGSSANDERQGLTSGQTKALTAQLEVARASAAANNVAGTRAAIAKFRGSVARLRRAGAISDPTARSLRIGAARLLQRIESDNRAPAAPTPAPQAQTQTQTTPAPAPQPPGQKKKDEKKKEKHGKGHGKEDD